MHLVNFLCNKQDCQLWGLESFLKRSFKLLFTAMESIEQLSFTCMLSVWLVIQQEADEALCMGTLAVEWGHSQLDCSRFHEPRHLGEGSNLVTWGEEGREKRNPAVFSVHYFLPAWIHNSSFQINATALLVKHLLFNKVSRDSELTWQDEG